MPTNSLPPYKMFRGHDLHTKESSFDPWLKQFAKENDKQKLFQLKSLLEKTAVHVVHMMPSKEQTKCTSVMKKRDKRLLDHTVLSL